MALRIIKITKYKKSTFDKIVEKIHLSIKPLNDYLKQFAYKNTESGLFITYFLEISTDDFEKDIDRVGYISFSQSLVETNETEAKEYLKISPSLTYPIPVLKISRLAVFDKFQKQGYGNIFIAYAEILAFIEQNTSGCKALVVDSKKTAIGFYKNANFIKIQDYNDNKVSIISSITTIFNELKKVKEKKLINYFKLIKYYLITHNSKETTTFMIKKIHTLKELDKLKIRDEIKTEYINICRNIGLKVECDKLEEIFRN